MYSASENSEFLCSASPSHFLKIQPSVADVVLRIINEKMSFLIPGKIKGLIKLLPEAQQVAYYEQLFSSLKGSLSINQFLENLTVKIHNTPLSQMTAVLEIYTKSCIIPTIKTLFDETDTEKFYPTSSALFFKEFTIDKSKKLYDIPRIKDYLNQNIPSISFGLNLKDETKLLNMVNQRLELAERQDNRELCYYAPLQRRLDSLARLLSLKSNYSACVALTIHDSKLVISANVTDGVNPRQNIDFFKQRIKKIREFLNQVYSGDLLIFKSEDGIHSDILRFFEQGGQLYDLSFEFLNVLFTENFIEALEQLYQSLESDKLGGLGIRKEYFIKDAYKLAVTAYIMKHDIDHPTDSILDSVVTHLSAKDVAKNADDSISPFNSPQAGKQSLSNFPFSPIRTQASSHVFFNESMLLRSTPSPTPPSPSTEAATASSSDEASPPESPNQRHGTEVVPIELRNMNAQEFSVILGKVNSTNVVYLTPSLNESRCLSLIIDQDEKPLESWVINEAYHGKISDVHAEQIIMVSYLEKCKNIELTNPISPKIHIGLSKFACSTCDEVKSHFPAVVLTGKSNVSFPNVENLKYPKRRFFDSESLDDKCSATNELANSAPSTPIKASMNIMGRKDIHLQSGLTVAPVSPYLSPGSKKAKLHHHRNSSTELACSASSQSSSSDLACPDSPPPSELGCPAPYPSSPSDLSSCFSYFQTLTMSSPADSKPVIQSHVSAMNSVFLTVR